MRNKDFNGLKGCNCGEENTPTNTPNVIQINNNEAPVLFHRVSVPASMGTSEENPPVQGAYKNVILYYEADESAYLYNSDGIFTRLTYGKLLSPVDSVNGKTGVVVLNASDIDAQNSQTIQANLDRIDNTAEQTIDNLAVVEAIAKGAQQAIVYGNYETFVTAFNALDGTEYNAGQNVMIVTLEVPDLWISSVEEISVPYTYTTDEAFVSQLEADGYVQVGYYKVSQLETQKVDLTDYVKNTDYAAPSKGGVVKINPYYKVRLADNGQLYADINTYSQYNSADINSFISKGTLDNVITGKGLVSSQEANKLKVLTSAEYDALTTHDPNTLYLVKEHNNADSVKVGSNSTAGAANSEYRGKDLTNVYTIEQLSAKVQAGDFSDIRIGDYITKTVKVGSGAERQEDFVIAGVDYWLGVGDTELTTHHLLMIPKNGFYDTMKMNDTGTTTGGYYGSQAHGIATVAYTAGTGGSLTRQVADYTTFLESNLGENDGSYVFTRNASGKWEYDGAEVGANLNTYGITYTGTPVEGDKLTLTFAKGYLEPYRKAIYDVFGDSHIIKHRSFQTVSTSSSEWHNARVELMNECMVYGCKIFANNNYGEMVAPTQLPYFSMTPSARVAHRGKGGSRNGAWLSSFNGGSGFCVVYASGNADYTSASSALVVRPYFLFA